MKKTTNLLMVIAIFCLLLPAAAIGFDGASGAGTASGTLKIDGRSLNLRYAYALAQPNAFDVTKTDIAVLISGEPLPPDELKDMERLLPAAMKELHGWVHIILNDRGEPTDEMVDHPALNGGRLLSTGGPGATKAKFTPKVFSKDLIEGSFETTGAVKFVDHTYDLEVSIRTSVVQAKRPVPLPDEKTGMKLPSDGGEPGEAYRAFVKAVRSRDIAGIRKWHQGTDKEPDSEIEKGMEFLDMMMPADLKVDGGYASDNQAVLYLTGNMEKERQYGTVEMKRNKDGAWQAGNEKWSNIPPAK